MPFDPSDPHSISVIIPVHNGTATLTQCLEAVWSSGYTNFECIVVDDGSTDESAQLARQFPARVVEIGTRPHGPAFARNHGAEAAQGALLFFIDADVVIYPDTLQKVADSFVHHPKISAVFGSYDESPAVGTFLSQYKNLLHHFVHQQGQEDASTFWSGCGAIRRDIFLEFGGFDADRYPRPSIEDIELGYRLRAAGLDILLNKTIQVKHLKKWSLLGLLKTDVFDRAVPWTRLILQNRSLPNDLNLERSQRWSTMLLALLLLFLGFSSWYLSVFFLPLLAALFVLVVASWRWKQGPSGFGATPIVEIATYATAGLTAILAYISGFPQLLPLIALLVLGLLTARWLWPGASRTNEVLFNGLMAVLGGALLVLLVSYPLWLTIPLLLTIGIIVILNRQLYSFLAQKQGIPFASAALPLQLLYYLYSGIAFALGGGLHIWETSLKPRG